MTGGSLRTQVDPDAFRSAWSGGADDPDDHSMVVVLDGVVIATEAVTAVVAHAFETLGMRREQHGVGDSWHAEHGWLDGYTYALLAGEWAARASAAPVHSSS